MFLELEKLKILLADFGGEVQFSSACITKMSPHSWPVIIWGLKNIDGEIFAFDKDGKEIMKINKPSFVCNTLIQRLKLIQYESLQRNNSKNG